MTDRLLLAHIERLLEAATRATRDGIERRLRGRLRVAFAQQGRSALAAWRNGLPFGPALDRHWAAFNEPLTTAATAALAVGYRGAASDLGAAVAEADRPPRVRNWRDKAAQVEAYVQDQRSLRWRNLDAVTRKRLDAVLAKSSTEGWGYARTETALRKEVAGLGLARADTIARTEVAHAYESGRRIAADDLAAQGQTLEKRWLIVSPEDAACQDDGAGGWIALADPWPSGHDQPPAHPRCVCSVQYRTVKAGEGD